MVDFTGGTWRSLIDGSEVSAIPDSVVGRFNAKDEDSTGPLSTISDQVGPFDLSGSCDVIDDGINGNRSYRFDGSETMRTTDTVTTTPRYGYIFVRQQQEEPFSNRFLAGGGFDRNFGVQDDQVAGDGEFDLFIDGDNYARDVGTVTTDPEIIEHWHDDGTSEFIKNGTVLATESTPTPDLEGFALSSRGDGDLTIQQDVGEAFLVVDWADGDREQFRDILSDSWGVSI